MPALAVLLPGEGEDTRGSPRPAMSDAVTVHNYGIVEVLILAEYCERERALLHVKVVGMLRIGIYGRSGLRRIGRLRHLGGNGGRPGGQFGQGSAYIDLLCGAFLLFGAAGGDDRRKHQQYY